MTLTGECFCGQVAYRIDGALKGAVSCHCSRCRKAFSAQASAYGLLDPATFSWTRGEDLLTSYVGQHGAGKQFCRVCGSMLAGVYQGQVHGIALGTLNDDPGITLDTHIFVGSKAPWEILPDGITAFDAFPPAPKP